MKARHAVLHSAGLGVAFCILCVTNPGWAINYTWDSSGNATSGSTVTDGPGTWSTANANWWSSGGTGDVDWPATGTSAAVFGAKNGAAGTVTVGGLVTTASVIFNAPGSGTYLLSGGTIGFAGTTPTINVTAASGIIGSVITDTTGLTKNGSGVLYLTGSGAYTGATNLNAGQLFIDNTSATSIVNITTSTAGTLGGSGFVSAATVGTPSGASGIEAGSGGLGSLSLGDLTFESAGKIAIFNVLNYANSAAIQVTAANGLLPEAGPGSVTINLYGAAPPGSGSFELLQYAGAVGGSSTAAFTLGNHLTGAGLRSSFSLNFANPGYIDLTCSVDYPIWSGSSSSAWFTSSGTAASGTTNWVLASNPLLETNFISTDAVVFNDTAAGSTVIINSGNVSPSSVTFNNNRLNYTLSSSGAYGIMGGATLTMNGSGTLTISNSNGYTGGTVVNAGLLNIANSSALGGPTGAGVYGALSISGGTLDNTSGGPLTLPNYPLNWNGNFTFKGSNPLNLGSGAVSLGGPAAVYLAGSALTVGGAISGVGSGITQNGSSLLVLTGSSNYSGPTNVNGGTLSVGNGGSGANLLATSGVALAANTTLLFNHSDSVTFAPPIGGSGNVVQAGGLLSLASGNSSYSGGTIVSSGTLQANGTGGLGPVTGTLTVSAAGVVDLNGASPTIGVFSGNGLIDNVSAGGTPVLTIGNGGGSGTFSGTIQNTTGVVSLVKIGAGTQTLSGTGTFSGSTQITGGTLVASALALQQSTVTVAANNSLAFSGPAAALGGLSGSASLNFGSTNVSVGANNGNTIYTGIIISGGGGLTKTGSGILALTAANTYGGATNISGGILRLSLVPAAGPVTSNLLFWLDPSSANNYQLSGQYVTQVNDLSPNGYNFANATSTVTVVKGGSAFNNLNVLNFDGSANGTLTMPFTTSPQSVFIVENVNLSVSGSESLFGFNGQGIHVAAGPVIVNPGGTSDYTNSGGALYVNGLPQSGNASAGAPQLLEAYAGANSGTPFPWSSTSLGNPTFNGEMGEVLAYSTSLTPSQSQQNESYLMYKWLGVGAAGGASNVLPSTTPLTISHGGTFDMTNGTQTIAALSSTDGNGSQVLLGTTGLLTIAGSASTTFDGVISGAGGSLTLQGGGLALTNSNTYTGGTTVSGGTLQLGDGGLHNGSLAGNILNNSAVVFANPMPQVYGGAISGSGSLTKTGAGILAVSGSNTYSGTTTIANGVLRLGNLPTSLPVTAGLLYWLDASNLASAGATGGSVATWGDLSGNGRNFTAVAASVPLVPNVMNGLPMLQFNGSTTVFTNSPTSGLNAQTVIIATVPAATQVSGVLPGIWGNYGGDGGIRMGDLGEGTNNQYTWRGLPTTPGDATDANDFTDVAGGNTYLTFGSNFDLNSTNFNTAGTPQIITAVGGPSNSATTGIGGYYDGIGGGRDYAGYIGEVLAYNTVLTSAQRQEVEAYLDYKWLGIIPPGFGFGTNALPTTTALSIGASGTLDLFGVNQTVASLSGGGTVTNSYAGAAALLTIAGSTSATFSGVIQDGGTVGMINLAMSGPGTQVLSGANTFSGSTTITGGVLGVAVLANGGSPSGIGASSNSAANLLIDGGTLQYTGSGATTDRLFAIGPTTGAATIDASGSGPLVFSNTGAVATVSGNTVPNTLTLQGSSTAANRFAPSIQDPSSFNTSLVKNGPGTWVLTGQSRYTGPTLVNAGKLVFAPGSSVDETAMTVAGGATLAVQPGGGTLSTTTLSGIVGASLTLQQGSVFDMTEGATAVGTFNLAAGAASSGPSLVLGGATLLFDLSSSGADDLLANWGLASVSSGNEIGINALGSLNTSGTYTIISVPGGGLNPADFSLVSNTVSGGGSTYTLTLTGNSTQEEVFAKLIPLNYWAHAVSGSWNVGSNWSVGTAPNGAGQVAVFSASTSSNVTVTLNASETVGTLEFANSGNRLAGYDITGTQTLTLSNGGSPVEIDVLSGTHAINAPLALSGNLDIELVSGATLGIGNNISQNSAGLSLTLGASSDLTGGALVLDGANNYTGGTNVEAGTLVAGSATALAEGTSLTVGQGASSLFAAASAGPAVTTDGVASVPEPGTLALLLAAALGSAAVYWRSAFTAPVPAADRR